MPLSDLAPSGLEAWYRDFYLKVDYDISGSGLPPLSVARLGELAGFSPADLGGIVLADSDCYGAERLRAAIRAHWAIPAPGEVMVTQGSSEAIFLVMSALLRAGDVVVVPAPGYHSLRTVAAAVGARLVDWPAPMAPGDRPDLDLLHRLGDLKPAMVVVNYPHNPTGTALTDPERRAIEDFAVRTGAILVWDLAFRGLEYDGPPTPLPDVPNHLVLGTMSKAYGLPGLRIGWCAGSPALLRRLVGIRDASTMFVSPVAEFLACQAVEHAGALFAPHRELLTANRRLLTEWADGVYGRDGWRRPEAGACCLVRVPGEQDTVRWARTLAEEDGVLVVPGESFDRPGWIRLGFGVPAEEFRAGLSRMAARFPAA